MKKKTFVEVSEELAQNHNTSWIEELYKRNKDRLDTVAIIYRGTKITYRQFFHNVEKYAKALAMNGVKHGSNFVAVLQNTPEYAYFLGAASALGARITIISSDFDQDYIKSFIDASDSKNVFVSDMDFSKMKNVLSNVDKDVVLVPLEHSLKHGNPYKSITERFYKLDEEKLNKDIREVETHNEVRNLDSFIKDGDSYDKPFRYEKVSYNEPFTVTFSSGSTNSTRPKAIMHNAKSYIYMGRYHDQDVSDYPTMKGAATLACIPPHSNTNINNCVSDTLMEGGKICFEPIYDENYYIYSLIINKPTLALGTRSHWIKTLKRYYGEPEFKNVKFPFMLVPVSVGEPLAANEEKALNKMLKKARAGIDIIPSPTSFVTMSVGGGDCEHGGIFFVLFRALQSKLPRKNMNEPIGMLKYNMVDVVALRPDGTVCAPYECGELVCNSPCTMIGYLNNEEANRNFYVTDVQGRKWTRLNTYGYTDGKNHVYVKGRIQERTTEIPEFVVNDVVLKDTKKILSSEVVKINKDGETVYVAHVEPMINTSINKANVITSIYNRCIHHFGKDFGKKLYVRWHTNEEGFALTKCGKRSNLILIDEGLDKCESNIVNIVKVNKKTRK